jgi:NAD(P)-dependent dehydrogenase (short-subunit alcohol dehydrogenase family)
MEIHFDNQTVIVTGAARGIGGGIVEGFRILSSRAGAAAGISSASMPVIRRAPRSKVR